MNLIKDGYIIRIYFNNYYKTNVISIIDDNKGSNSYRYNWIAPFDKFTNYKCNWTHLPQKIILFAENLVLKFNKMKTFI